MKFKVQQFSILGIAIATSLVVGSCAGGKVSQCASMIKVVNQAVTDTKDITAAGTKGDVATIEKLVGIFERAAKDLDSVSLEDAQLKAYQGQFSMMYKGASEINKQLVASIKERKATKVMEGLRKSRDTFSPESNLATGLTQYCKEPEQK